MITIPMTMQISCGDDMMLPVDYEDDEQLINRPKINGKELVGDMTPEELDLQTKLIAGENITIEDNDDGTQTISAKGGSGSGELSADLIVSNPIGRFAMDDKIDEGTPFETIFRGMLSKVYYPTLTAPSAALSWAAPALAKVGAAVSAMAATLSFNRGSINPQYTAESPYRAGDATNYNLKLTGAASAWEENKTSGSFSVPSFTRNSKGNVTLDGTVAYNAGAQPKDSDGSDYDSPLPAGTISASKTIEFILPFYHGASAVQDVSSLAGLTEDLTKKGAKTYTFTANDEYTVIVYNASYGDITSIKDQNNVENIDGWTNSTKTIDGQSYKVWVSPFKITGSMTYTFIF